MNIFEKMPIKFFHKDVIGQQPKKIGDVFEAMFMGRKSKFKVSEMYESRGMFFATLVTEDVDV